MTDLRPLCDLAIIGAGPAGLSAAVAARAAGAGHVVVLEREAEPGGIPRHCGHSPYGMREFRRVMGGRAYAARLAAEARAAGAEIHCETSVIAIHPGGRLLVSTPKGAMEIGARRVLLATGCRETSRAARLIGGEKPGGILNTGALQGLVYLQGITPFRRPLIVGSELVAFSALLTCRHAGMRPVGMAAPEARPLARWPAGLLPRLMGVPFWGRTRIAAIHGHDRVTGVTLEGPDGPRDLACDGVILSGRFRPENALALTGHLEIDPATRGPVVDSDGRCSDPAYFAAGNALRGVETAGWCWAEGRRIGVAIAADLARGLPSPTLTVAAEGALAYALPARIRPGSDGLPDLQLRAARPLRGRLTLTLDGTEILSRTISARPERRITLPLSILPAGASGRLVVRLEEGG
ncbi:NAD(P)/FAD-dependent oxidoreductase [Aliigemmobacter aestuarii]|uniref:NAD(P)/FAD-dependent oxidoreductase n=1 Tax=Aliigemmobacter aestuarii TaxID=1445661 RepID=A0A4S3MR47_9RHOB|nr:FAD/NAD(P)-binding oxidoreductase [Gemmobacter aestuarii]THD84513.1 NAD(P)/FAD-dependent oxidoreductase [Gemmobacter aestuarii]